MFISVTFTLLLCVCGLSTAIEEAPYEVVSDAETYQERLYPARKWVSTSTLSISHDEAGDRMFQLLFNYIDGQNDAGIKIDMTSPVTTLVQPGEGPNCESSFTESFYIPAVHQENPPVPTNSDVYIEDRAEMTVFSRRFHGFAVDSDWIINARALAEDLFAAGENSIDYNTYYTVGYDSPFSVFNRTNEVWFFKN